MRDALAYKLGRDLGRYAPRTRFCEVILNGSYEGIYVLIEKIKRNKNRVDINKLQPEEIAGDDVTGGYILKIDKTTGDFGRGWVSGHLPPMSNPGNTISILYDYPDENIITTAQKKYIKGFMDEFEATLSSDGFRDPVNGYAKFIDVDSFIDFFIMNEVSKNVDGYRISTFMHKQRNSDGGKLVMGPIWDFNLGFGNANYCTSGGYQGLVLDFNSLCPEDTYPIPFWWYRLMDDPAFTSKLSERWSFLRSGKFRTSVINDYIDSTFNVLNLESAHRNFERWPVLGNYVWPNYYIGTTFESEVAWMKSWISSRMIWLDNALATPTTGADNESQNGPVSQPFPNPFKEDVTVEFAAKGVVQFDVYSAMGDVKESIVARQSGKGKYTLGRQLAPGIYFCVVSVNGKKVVNYKLIKQN
jgi:hypothetical protein